MFTTTMQVNATTTEQERELLDDDREIRVLRMLARAGDLPERDAQLLLGAAEQRASRRRARVLALGRTGRATTLELEAWHGDAGDAETRQLRVELQASGLL